KLMLNGVQIMVVDEADRMLDMGFIPDIERIFKLTPFTRQTLFFSATMAPEITRITQEFLHNPVRVEVARQATTSETITQAVCMHKPSRKDSGPKDKRDILRAIISAEGDSLTNAIIFCNRKRDVDIVAKSLKKHDLDAAALHGDLDQSLRMKILNGFRDGELRLLVASDVAARGLDIPNVSHVFNFDVPIHSEDYVHRIGRTGRAGREGKAITLCLPFEEKYLASIEALVKKDVPRMDNPLKNEASAPKAEEKPAKRSRPQKEADKPKLVEAPEEKPVQPAKTEPSKPAPRENNKRSDNNRSDNNRSDNNRRPQRGRGRGRDNGPSVIGMGDHVPAFMTRDLRALQAAATAKEVEEETPEVVEEAVEAIVEVVAVETPVEEAPKKPRRRRAPKKTVEETTEVAEQKSEAPVAEEAVVNEAVADEAIEEKPAKKPRKRRVTKKKEEPVAEETPADEPKAE
ncbi:MAG: DEAD/DEAH box helicase, partial [Rhodobacteraceae bacterium]|nr:DEAD/DEAH box helicase [Paracoccaceae bacterium]